MYILYVDESGDTGINGSPTKNFILSAIVVHETNWRKFLDELIEFRRELKKTKGLLMREEIHASLFVSKRVKLKTQISRNDRLDILKKSIDWLKDRNYIEIITVRIDKLNNSNIDVFESAWKLLIQRFENTLMHRNFVKPAFPNDFGIIVSDNTDVKKLKGLVRKMRRINYVPSRYLTSPDRNMPLIKVIKDPIFRDSSDSYILQMVDVIAYFAKQIYDPNKYVKSKAAKLYYSRLLPIINDKVTGSNKNYRIIEH